VHPHPEGGGGALKGTDTPHKCLSLILERSNAPSKKSYALNSRKIAWQYYFLGANTQNSSPHYPMKFWLQSAGSWEQFI
jgi:hypothetical protein